MVRRLERLVLVPDHFERFRATVFVLIGLGSGFPFRDVRHRFIEAQRVQGKFRSLSCQGLIWLPPYSLFHARLFQTEVPV